MHRAEEKSKTAAKTDAKESYSQGISLFPKIRRIGVILLRDWEKKTGGEWLQEGEKLNDKEAKRFYKIAVVSVRTLSGQSKMAQQKKSFCCHCYLGLI